VIAALAISPDSFDRFVRPNLRAVEVSIGLTRWPRQSVQEWWQKRLRMSPNEITASMRQFRAPGPERLESTHALVRAQRASSAPFSARQITDAEHRRGVAEFSYRCAEKRAEARQLERKREIDRRQAQADAERAKPLEQVVSEQVAFRRQIGLRVDIDQIRRAVTHARKTGAAYAEVEKLRAKDARLRKADRKRLRRLTQELGLDESDH